MEIDIISFTQSQYELLSDEQIVAVQEEQQKKNRLEIKLEEEKLAEKHRLVKQGTFLSGVWQAYCDSLQAKYEQELESVRTALLFYLQYTLRPTPENTVPYTLDYSLTVVERVRVVKEYYESTFTDPDDLFHAFVSDKVAPSYLVEGYKPLYDYFLAGT